MSIAEKDKNPHEDDLDMVNITTWHPSKSGAVVKLEEQYDIDEYTSLINRVGESITGMHFKGRAFYKPIMTIIVDGDISDLDLIWELERKNEVTKILQEDKMIDVLPFAKESD